MFTPHVFVAIVSTAIVCFLLGRVWCFRERDRLAREFESTSRRESSLLSLLLRERGERQAEVSEVRRVESSATENTVAKLHSLPEVG